MNLTQKQVIEELLKHKIITSEILEEAKRIAEKVLKSVEDVLIEKDFVKDSIIGKIKADILGFPYINLSDIVIPPEVLSIIPYPVAASQKVIVFEKTKTSIAVAMNNPGDIEMINLLEKKTNLEPIIYFATKRDIRKTLNLYTRDINQKFEQLLKNVLEDPSKIESLKDTTKILDTIINFAYQSDASDIHIEPMTNETCVRYRMDGILQDVIKLPKEIHDLLTSRIKVLAGLRTDEHRIAQDGRFKTMCNEDELTLRVSILPIYDGEKTVMRLLGSKPQNLNLVAMGYAEKDFKIIKENIGKSHGMILITGPTGSGKTTTLYAILQMLNSREINISTIEDPIEYHFEGVNQVQVNNKTSLTFANGLRSLLRQDPDVIMIGEIRDEETANIAVNSALTGHLVLATLHTNNAASTLPRLLEMDIETFLVASTVNIVVAQRLVRRICTKCKHPIELDSKDFSDFRNNLDQNNDLSKYLNINQEKITLFKGKGCEKCNYTGYKSRVSIVEVLEIDEPIKQLILKKASPHEIEQAAIKSNMQTMFIDGLAKVNQGITTIEEILRVMKN